jgi:hypothetical protein
LKLLWGTLLCIGGAFAILVIGIIIRDHFSWAKIVAQLDAFFAALGSGDLPQVIAALTSGPVILAILGFGIGASLLFQRRRGD